MCYVMICYAGMGPVQEIMKSNVPIYVSLVITGLIVVANFGVMIRMTIQKVKQKMKLRKKQQKRKKLLKLQAESQETKSPDTPAKRGLMAIKEVSEEDDLMVESFNANQKQEEELMGMFSAEVSS